MRRGAALVLGAAAVCSVSRGGFGIAPFRRSASDFHGSLKAITKVACGAALRDYDATIHLVYIPPLFGTQRIGESNSAACIFEHAPKGTLLPFGITAKLRAIDYSNSSMLLLDACRPCMLLPFRGGLTWKFD